MDNEKNFCCGCNEPIGEEHGPDCDEARAPILHWNVGGPRGWTTACGIESSSFTDNEDERKDVDCKRCLRSLAKEREEGLQQPARGEALTERSAT